jgi:hypothetical protein
VGDHTGALAPRRLTEPPAERERISQKFTFNNKKSPQHGAEDSKFFIHVKSLLHGLLLISYQQRMNRIHQSGHLLRQNAFHIRVS